MRPSRPSLHRVSAPSAAPAPCESLLVLSDVHLGSDVNDAAPPDGVARRSRDIDEDLIALLAHYRGVKPSGERWRLVVAGDLIDFIGVVVRPAGEPLATELSEEEQENGLGAAADHARVKLRRVAARHADVFAALAEFVRAGNALTVVHGNHDLEFYWDAVREDFAAILLEHARAQDGALDAAAFASRVEFTPWFFYRKGVAYIEHGHQYDPLCATDLVMAPLSPIDPRRVARGFCDVLLRFVVRPTRGLKEHGHEHLGVSDYLAFGAKLGLRGMLTLGLRFARAVIELFRVQREQFASAAQHVREEHERRLAKLAERSRLGVDRLRALLALQVKPVTSTVRGIMASLLLDRLALGAAAAVALAVVLAFALAGRTLAWWVAPCVALAWWLGHRWLARARQMDPAQGLVERATQLARLFPAAFVVMGHTHVPVQRPVSEGATYINSGSWAEEEGEGERRWRAARTHVVIHVGERGPVAELLAWDPQSGPRRYRESMV